MESIESVLKENEITASIKQISKKLTDLKNYYGGQRRLIESSKSSGAGTDEVYVSQWKFYENLQFLNDAFTTRKTKSNADDEDDNSTYGELTINHLLLNQIRKLLKRKITSFIK